MKFRIEFLSLAISLIALTMSTTQTYVSWRNRDAQYRATVLNQRIEIASAVLTDLSNGPHLINDFYSKMANYVGYEKRMLSVKWDYSSASNASLYRVMRINSETLGQDVRSSLNKINAWTDLTTHDLERLYLTFPSDIIHTVKLVMDQMPMPDENDETLRQLSNQVEFLRDDPSLADMTELQSAVDTINQQQAKARVDSEHVRKLIVDLETKFIDYIKAATLE